MTHQVIKITKQKSWLPKKLIDVFYPWTLAFGFDPFRTKRALRGLLITFREYQRIKSQNALLGKKYEIKFSYPVFSDRYEPAGIASGHYFHQDLLVAQKIYQRNPTRHVDVASRVDGFVAHVASFRSIEVFDIRQISSKVPNITFRQYDLTKPQNEYIDYCDSLSCLHALEHFGLGRYGDPIDIGGHVKGFENLRQILKVGGIMYLSVPIGPERIDFNAHRAFAIATILSMAENDFKLLDFSFVDDAGELHRDIPLTQAAIECQCGCIYGCGIFEFQKVS